MMIQHGNQREIDDGAYHIVINADPLYEAAGNPPAIRGYDITSIIQRKDGMPVHGQYRMDVRHTPGIGMTLDQALDHGQRFAEEIIVLGFSRKIP
ncbi:hypothetical protein [Burkholderia guangdongensis]|uniref:hypothetical protein n=1 Tax=Burkholderia guangdongensis TaxID=1792500 RepID=UPI0015CB5EF6|nr:hypothetical protein [Burkholderia guangdongensis]